MRLSRVVGEEGQLADPERCRERNRRIERVGRDVARMEADLERLLAYRP